MASIAFFSADFFPGYQMKMQLVKTDVYAGQYYRVIEGPMSMLGMKGWLCPATLLYYDDYPDVLYLKAENLESLNDFENKDANDQ